MITFRQHIVTLVAVFLALAVGVVLGGGPLQDVATDAVSSLDGSDDGTGLDDEAVQAEIAHSGEVARTLAASALAGRLTDRPVALVRTPDADPATVKGLGEAVTAAGGTLSGTWTLQEGLLAPSEKSLVDTMTSQLATQLGDAAGGAGDASTYVRAGNLLGRAVATTAETTVATDAPATSILDTFTQAGLVTASEGTGGLAPLVLVVLGDGAEEDATDEAADPILEGLLTGLSSAARGVVVAAPTGAARGGVMERLRESGVTVGSTVDGVETGVGQVTAGLALVAAYGGVTGNFGASGSDGTPSLG